ncbi:CaiB/BaiF CoA transferase family protein [Gulosibacter chungangensis]|uniref:CoA transferase n=1 Tax=Gulosibacter chungangensis TaxID=979746 RepID=A0A7J5BFT0_9MICO|nr:CaiB/BaiF CoA-transferase family protein [Gulosibacter chungangensis]KAB1645131.1 CoA transferase [Gulosibacter chungangensis]
MTGPLHGIRVVEFAGLGPIPHTGMILADLGAEVVRIARPGPSAMAELAGATDHVLRGRVHTTADLKNPADLERVAEILRHADALIEGYRPGVMEKLGLGPEQVADLNPRLIYGRMTGWGREGPRAQSAGHDLNYLAVTGVLHSMGKQGSPPPVPLTLLGDYAGGSMLLALGITSALLERASSGRGQVVDTAMVDGIGLVAQKIWALRGSGVWSDERDANLLDGHAPFYDTYTCADGRFVAVGAIERKFFAQFVALLGLDPTVHGDQYDRDAWPAWRAAITSAIARHTRDEWAERSAGTDACLTPVLTFAEALADAHARERDAFISIDGVAQAAPAPRFSRSELDVPGVPDAAPITLDRVAQRWSHG